jgi:hypothetical protein
MESRRIVRRETAMEKYYKMGYKSYLVSRKVLKLRHRAELAQLSLFSEEKEENVYSKKATRFSQMS